MRMLLKENPSCLDRSKDLALKKRMSLSYRLSKDKEYFNLYKEFLKENKLLGHVKQVKKAKNRHCVL